MHKPFLRTASLLGALAVALGAFGAHSLKGRVSDAAVNTFEAGVRYQFYHVIVLILLAILYKEFKSKWILFSGNLFLLGILLFSGSLYTITFLVATLRHVSWIGIITPLGGLAFIAGWFCLLMAIISNKKE